MQYTEEMRVCALDSTAAKVKIHFKLFSIICKYFHSEKAKKKANRRNEI